MTTGPEIKTFRAYVEIGLRLYVDRIVSISYDANKQKATMDWLDKFLREKKRLERLADRRDQEKKLMALKKKHEQEKLEKLESLKKKLEDLKNEIGLIEI